MSSLIEFVEQPWLVNTNLTLAPLGTARITNFLVAMENTFTAGGTKIVLPTNPTAEIPQLCEVRCTIVPPAVAGIIIQVFQGTIHGPMLFDVELDDLGTSVFFSVVFSISQNVWVPQFAHYNGIP